MFGYEFIDPSREYHVYIKVTNQCNSLHFIMFKNGYWYQQKMNLPNNDPYIFGAFLHQTTELKVRGNSWCFIELLYVKNISIDSHGRLLKVYVKQTADLATVRQQIIRFSKQWLVELTPLVKIFTSGVNPTALVKIFTKASYQIAWENT